MLIDYTALNEVVDLVAAWATHWLVEIVYLEIGHGEILYTTTDGATFKMTYVRRGSFQRWLYTSKLTLRD
jgi:hypothetical protein